MKLPQLRRLVVDDFPKQGDWIRPLFLVLNSFMESIVNGLTNGLTINDNMAAKITTVTFDTAPSASAPVSLTWNLSRQPKVVLVGNATGTITAAPGVTWQISNTGALQITGIFGVSAPTTLTLVIFAG